MDASDAPERAVAARIGRAAVPVYTKAEYFLHKVSYGFFTARRVNGVVTDDVPRAVGFVAFRAVGDRWVRVIQAVVVGGAKAVDAIGGLCATNKKS